MKRPVNSPDAPAAVGPYSHGIATDNMFFVSGQIPLVPETGKLAGKDIDAQAHQVFANLKAVLAANGMTLQNVVKTTVFMVDLVDFKRFNAIYATYFPDSPPARSCVQVTALPQGAHVEVEAIAVK